MRITLIHQAALGDTILLIPLIRSLRQRFVADGSHITLVTHTNFGQMLMMLGLVDAHAAADDPAHTCWFGDPEGKPLPEWAACDLLISAVSDGNDLWAANARRLSTAGQFLFFQARPPVDYPRHVIDWHREQLAALALPEPPLPLPLHNPDGAIVIHPGSGGEAKCWPRDKFLQLGRDLQRNGLTPTFILGEVEQDRWGFHLIKELQNEFPWYLHMGLYELSQKLARARLFVGNDAGVGHLAAAIGIPVITLFGPSNEHQWRPIGPSVQLLRPPAPDKRDLTALPVETVLAEILAELRKVE